MKTLNSIFWAFITSVIIIIVWEDKSPLEADYSRLMREYRTNGIEFPEVVFAQSVLETGWGKSPLVSNYNLWGKKPGVNESSAEGSIHAGFNGPYEAWNSYTDFQQRRLSAYRKYRKPVRTNEEYLEFLECMCIPKYGVDKCFPYAEDPNYTSKIQQIMSMIDSKIE